MINIPKNQKKKFVKILGKELNKLEKKLYNKVKVLLNRSFRDVAEAIQHGDILNMVPVIVNRHKNDFITIMKTEYRRIGSYSYKKIENRLKEIRLKNFDRRQKKGIENFWYWFNIWINQQALLKVENMNQTTKNTIVKIIDKGVKEGKSYTEISKDIRKKTTINRSRAEAIAVTEVHTAFNKAIFESIQNENVKMETKEWVNAGDERVRGPLPFDHISANGEIVGVNERFVRTNEPLMYPGDFVNGSAGNIIRCRCVAVYSTEITEITPIGE